MDSDLVDLETHLSCIVTSTADGSDTDDFWSMF